jgi:hypothetical protein
MLRGYCYPCDVAEKNYKLKISPVGKNIWVGTFKKNWIR